MSDALPTASPEPASAQRSKSLWTDSFLYGGANVLSRAGSLVTFMVLTRHFPTEIYGAIDALLSYGTLAAVFVSFGMDSTLGRFHYDTEDAGFRRRLAAKVLCVQGMVAVPVLAFAVSFPSGIALRLVGNSAHGTYVTLLAMALPFIVLEHFFRNYLMWTFRKYPYIVLALATSFLLAGSTILFCLGLGLGLAGVFLAQLVSYGTASLLGLFFGRSFFVGGPGPPSLRELLAYSWPHCFNGVLYNSIPALDRLFLVQLASLTTLGWYAAGARVAGLIGIPILAFQTAWAPLAYSIHKRPEAQESFSRVLMMYAMLFSGGLLLLIPLAPLLVTLVASSNYLEGARVFAPVGFALVVESIAWIAGIGVELSKKSYLGSISYGSGVAAFVVALALLVPPFGHVGAGYALLLSRVVQAVSYTVFGFRAYPLKMRWRSAAALLILAMAAGLVAGHVRLASPALSLSIALPGAAACLAGFAVLYSRSGRALRDAMPGRQPEAG